MKRFAVITMLSLLLAAAAIGTATAQRRVTPVNNAATRTQPKNDARADSARVLERKRARSIQYTDDNGNIVMVDTLTGTEWRDSTLLPKPPKMKYPLLNGITVGVNILDPVLRAFGQKYGGADASVSVNLHNRYFPTFEFGMGTASDTPSHSNYTYKTPLAPYFRIGADYNFIYNSNPDYKFFAGVRYGFSPFKFTISDVTVNDDYWGSSTTFTAPQASVTAGWIEVNIGLRIRIVSQLSLGWQLKFHSMLHQSHPSVGDAWYIPGYGTQNSSLAASFSIYYTLPLGRKKQADRQSGTYTEATTGTQPQQSNAEK